ncbi:ELMO/CED-12 family protein [Oesophagostomum dentatum]|uniref:ELMO/CED-12 family protein n=1 Tax=Oesophagostomum dentatum TaxID=61180 RepID=A0A0B1TTW7_OESDE|nr:ELMO/CED-12 family protein [Oesophagostomum dentatum]
MISGPRRRLLIAESTKFLGVPADENDVRALLGREIVRASASSEEQLDAWREQLLTSPLGKLAVDTFATYTDEHSEDLRILVSENSMRSSGAAWQLVPVWINCISIVASIVGVIPCGNQSTFAEEECVEKLIELLFRSDCSFDSLFSVTVQLFHRTWREMHALKDEHEKVANVVHEQLRRAAYTRPANLAALEGRLSELSYWKMKDIWKHELYEKEKTQLESEVVSELRTLLKPSIEQLVRVNRKNALKQGFTFRRYLKGKTPHKGEDQFCFWKLDASDVLCFTDTDVDSYVEGVSHVGNIRKVAVKDIKSVERVDDMTARKSGPQAMRYLRIELHDGTSICGATFSDRALSAWLDGLTDLIGKSSLSADAESTAERLLNIELRLRLVDVPNPCSCTEVPPLPSDFSWVDPLFTHDLTV